MEKLTMYRQQHIFPRVGESKKGGTYGAALTQNGGRAGNASRGGLNTTMVNTHTAGAQPTTCAPAFAISLDYRQRREVMGLVQ
jgi:hypothetical protein